MQPTSKQRFQEGMQAADSPSRRGPGGRGILSAVVLLAFIAGGCRAHPVSLAMLIAGDAVNDADVKDRRSKLIGRPEAAADTMFGLRLETVVDVERKGVSLIAYPVEIDLLDSSRYIVEVEDGLIVVFAKAKRNIDGLEDVIHGANLKRKLIGKTPAECSVAGELGKPIRTLRSREKGHLLRLYNARHWSDFLGARYCLLRFGSSDRCVGVTLIGVSAATKKDPARR